MSGDDKVSSKDGAPVRSAKLQKYSAPALEKGLEILEYLSEQQDAKSMIQIASGVARSKNEIFRMMIVLEEKGYVDRHDTDSFVLSDKLYQLGLRRPGNKRLTDIALPLMEEFCESLPYCCYVSVASGEQSVIVAKADSVVPLGLSATIGHRANLIHSAEGLCLLAFMSEKRQALVIERMDVSPKDKKQLVQELKTCRKQGEIVSSSEMLPGVEHIAFPILDSIGDGAVAAITVPYIQLKNDLITLDTVKVELQQLSNRINKSFSHK